MTLPQPFAGYDVTDWFGFACWVLAMGFMVGLTIVCWLAAREYPAGSARRWNMAAFGCYTLLAALVLAVLGYFLFIVQQPG